ncbi:MAG: hypothetical protein ACSHW0_17275 [Thalassotalea sp.]
MFSYPMAAAESFMYFQHEGSFTATSVNYDKEVLELALRLTAKEYGEFHLTPTPIGLSIARVMKLAEEGKIKNYFFKYSARNGLSKYYQPIVFPIDRGIVGYRVAIISKDLSTDKIGAPTSINDLKKLTNAQGDEWLDAKILNKHNIPVFTVKDHNRIFELLSAGRVDLFFRGIHEWQDELIQYNNGELVLEQNFAIYYPLPRFFYTAKGNVLNAKRVKLGLERAFNNGDFQRLWESYYLASVKATQLSKRKIIILENPYITELSKDYLPYFLTLAEVKNLENKE